VRPAVVRQGCLRAQGGALVEEVGSGARCSPLSGGREVGLHDQAETAHRAEQLAVAKACSRTRSPVPGAACWSSEYAPLRLQQAGLLVVGVAVDHAVARGPAARTACTESSEVLILVTSGAAASGSSTPAAAR